MDTAQLLVRSVMRAFYDTRSVLVIEALLMHSVLRDDDMAYLMGMNTKDIHKLCAKLKEDRFLTVHTQNEPRPGQARGVNRTYYYIDYRIAVDAIKWRVYKIDKDMQGTTVPASEVKEYFCNFCKAQYTMLEVLDSPSAKGFLCQRCGKVLVHDRDRQSVGHQQSTRMNNQFRFITDLLPKIDSEFVPDITFEVAQSKARPVERAETHRVERSDPMDNMYNRPTAVKGLADTGPKSISINIQSAEDLTEEQIAAERVRKEKQAAKNALPEWHVKSTVTGQLFNTVAGAESNSILTKAEEEDQQKALAAAKKKEEEAAEREKQEKTRAYFAQLKAEKEAEEARKKAEEDEFESDDEDEDEFEDVVAPTTTNNSGRATPVAALGAALGAAPAVPSPLRQSSTSLKREAPGSGTNASTESPAGNGEASISDERPAKKVKTEEEPSLSAIPVASAAPAVPVKKEEEEDDDDDDDDIEFEDV